MTRKLPNRVPRILIIEDDPDIAAVLSDRLSAEACKVTVSSSGSAALEQVRSWEPDVVLLDLDLPIMAGLETLRAMRRDGSTVPVLAMTSSGLHNMGALSLKAGATDFVFKPFDYAVLRKKIEGLLACGSTRKVRTE